MHNNDRTVQFLDSKQDVGNYSHYTIESAPSNEDELADRKKHPDAMRVKPIFYPSGEHQYIKIILESLLKITSLMNVFVAGAHPSKKIKRQ